MRTASAANATIAGASSAICRRPWNTLSVIRHSAATFASIFTGWYARLPCARGGEPILRSPRAPRRPIRHSEQRPHQEDQMAKGRTSGSPRTPAPSTTETSPARASSSASRKAPAVRAPSAGRSPMSVSAETRRAMIAEAAYLRAERRGFVAGNEEEDWRAAEKEVDALLSEDESAPQ